VKESGCMMEPKKEPELLDSREQKIRKGNNSKSATLPNLFKAFATIKGTDEIEVKTLRETKNGKTEIFVEIRLLKNEAKTNEPKPNL
jgi:hypothetical protein